MRFIPRHSLKRLALFLTGLLPLLTMAETSTDQLILEELQKLNQRMDAIERRLAANPPAPAPTRQGDRMMFGINVVRSLQGNRVNIVYRNSPADKAGIRRGDLLTEIDGKPVDAIPAEHVMVQIRNLSTGNLTFQTKTGQIKHIPMTKVPQSAFAIEGQLEIVDGFMPLTELDKGDPAPDIVATGANGKEVRLSSLKGKVVLVNFTATWCGPCKAELPELRRIHAAHAKEGFEIISVFLDPDRATVEKHIKENEITWPCFFDPKGWDCFVSRQWGIGGVPTNPIVDRKGIIVEDSVRGKAIEPAIVKYLKQLP